MEIIGERSLVDYIMANLTGSESILFDQFPCTVKISKCTSCIYRADLMIRAWDIIVMLVLKSWR